MSLHPELKETGAKGQVHLWKEHFQVLLAWHCLWSKGQQGSSVGNYSNNWAAQYLSNHGTLEYISWSSEDEVRKRNQGQVIENHNFQVKNYGSSINSVESHRRAEQVARVLVYQDESGYDSEWSSDLRSAGSEQKERKKELTKRLDLNYSHPKKITDNCMMWYRC